MTVIDIRMETILCTSSLGVGSGTKSASEALSRRRGSSFDDDFEDW